MKIQSFIKLRVQICILVQVNLLFCALALVIACWILDARMRDRYEPKAIEPQRAPGARTEDAEGDSPLFFCREFAPATGLPQRSCRYGCLLAGTIILVDKWTYSQLNQHLR